jgi:hypothetical protein
MTFAIGILLGLILGCVFTALCSAAKCGDCHHANDEEIFIPDERTEFERRRHYWK